jgi:amino-acid N-acetyltransferase
MEESSKTGPVISPAGSSDLKSVSQLLSRNNLPVADLEAHLDSMVLARYGAALLGVVALEHYGETALLRSLCVQETHRSTGVGVALVSAIETAAVALGVRELYLLTVSAAEYFDRLGFTPVSRDQVPEAIRDTEQFRTLCPTSAICMRKRLQRAV